MSPHTGKRHRHPLKSTRKSDACTYAKKKLQENVDALYCLYCLHQLHQIAFNCIKQLCYVIDCFNSSIDSTIFALLYLSLSWKMTCYCCMLAKFKQHARVIFLKVSFYNNNLWKLLHAHWSRTFITNIINNKNDTTCNINAQQSFPCQRKFCSCKW